MPQFDSKTFNAEVFGKYLERVPRVKQDKLLEAGVLRPRRALRALLGDHAGGNYITVPMLGLIDGEPLNYDGETDLTAVSTRTYAQSMVVVGRMKAWEEKDFAADITGADFMDNVAMQVAEYWDGVDEDTLLAILKGVFAMTGEGNAEFVDRHTYDVTAAAEPYVGATTLNSAIQRAAGANKGIFRVVVCHSAVSTNLENLAAVEYLKYTDKRGVTRDLGLASWNGRLLLVDDGVGVEQGYYAAGDAYGQSRLAFGVPPENAALGNALIAKLTGIDVRGRSSEAGYRLFDEWPQAQAGLLARLTQQPYVAHNATFEHSWFMLNVAGYAESYRAGRITIIDTLPMSRQWDPGAVPTNEHPYGDNTLDAYAKRQGALDSAHNERHLGLEDSHIMLVAMKHHLAALKAQGKGPWGSTGRAGVGGKSCGRKR